MSDLGGTVSENVQKIVNDLPTVQQIALRPWQQNPLLATVLAQATALQEIAVWAAQAHQLAQQPEEQPAEPDGLHLVGEAG